MLRWNDEARALDLAVGDLLDSAPGAGAAMSARGRMAAGTEVHRQVQAAEGYRAEVSLRHVVAVDGWTCTLHGRVDGIYEEDGRTVVEEVKSTILAADDLQDAPPLPAWGQQLDLYLHAVEAAGHPEPVGRLRAVSLVDGSQRIFLRLPDPGTGPWLRDRLGALVSARSRWLDHLRRRRAATVHPAHDALRPGQAEIRAACFRAAAEGGRLLLVAPTGLGKTAAVVHGVLERAFAADLRVAWFTARNTQQAIVESTLRAMAARGTPLRAVTLRAREKLCRDCAPAGCPRALVAPDAEALLAHGVCDTTITREEAERQGACGHALAHAAAAAADVLVGDLNFGFEPGVRLRHLLEDGRWVAVVDEAHQLPERAREWGSPALDATWVDAILERFPVARLPALAEIARDVREAILAAAPADGDEDEVDLSPRQWGRFAERIDEVAPMYAAWAAAERARPLDWGTSGVSGAPPEEPWLDFARAVLRFSAALDRAGDETVAIGVAGTIRLVCRDAAPVLAPSMDRFHAVVCASATLHPTWFFRAQSGLREADELVVPSPFLPADRRVLLVRGVSTAYRRREAEWPRIAALVTRLCGAIPGSVAIYAPSFEMLHWLIERVDVGARARVVQSPVTGDAEREQVLSELRSGEPRALFAVLGGVFAEGVDLPGGVLAAAVIVSPALPPPSVERRLFEAYLDQRHGEGHALAYLQPGMTRVVQAAGRVVRGPGERGLVALVCQRFLQRDYREYLPADWEPSATSEPWVEAAAFFAAGPGGDR